VPPSKEEADLWIADQQQRCAMTDALRRDETVAVYALEEVSQALASLEQAVPGALPGALESARARRHAVWTLFRAGDAGESAFLQAVADVDKIVDDMLASAGALAEAKQLRRELADRHKCVDHARRALGQLDGQQRAFDAALAGRFAPWGWTPSNAHDAAAWAARLREADRDGSMLAQSTAALGESERAFASRWDRVATAAQFAEACDPARASTLADAAKRQLSLADQREGERNERSKRVERARDRVTEIESELAASALRDAGVATDIAGLMSELAIEPGMPPDILREVPRAERLHSLQASIAATADEHARLRSLIEAFERGLSNLTDALGLPPGVASLERAVAELRQEASREIRRAYLRSQLEDLRAEEAAAGAEIARHRSVLDAVLAEVGLGTEEAFVKVRDQISKASALWSQREREALTLREKEKLEPEFAEEVRGGLLSAGQERAHLERVAERQRECRSKRDEVLAARVGCELGKKRLDQASTAADFSLDASVLASEIGEQARAYARLRAAHVLLRASLERNQKEYESPVLRRASAILAQLTRGAYKGLCVELGDKGEPELRAIARDRRAKAASLLSEGTRNQMFLALKLAGVEQSCRDRSPLPLVLDDVLVHFDDERSEATLEALAELAKSTQVLLFTHHRRVADFASRLHGARVNEL
jgi:uncharacterized protein YhaN